MSREKGYLQTISCSISLSSCRIRAESLARAVNSRLWPLSGFRVEPFATTTYDTLVTASRNTATGCAATARVIEKPPHAIDMFKTADGYEVGHCWVNEMPTEDEESYDTPPCSSPPSPADNDIIVNPPTSMPFCAKFLSDFHRNPSAEHSVKNHSIFSDEVALRDKLQQYADSLHSDVDGQETYYDATEDEIREDGPEPQETVDCHNQDENTANKAVDGECDLLSIDPNSVSDVSPFCRENERNDETSATCILIEIQPPEATPKHPDTDGPSPNVYSKDVPINRRLSEVQELDAEERPRLLRSTSLKTGKTPPGTPSRKKIVRFADVLGLDLEAVRHIVCEDLPHVPSSAFDDLNLPPEADTAQQPEKTPSTGWESVPTTAGLALSTLYPLFTAPGAESGFLDRVRGEWVCLESATVSVMSVHCVCRVLNVAYEKQVTARYTTDDWRTWEEVLASYVPFSSDGEFDKFSFSLFLKPGAQENERLTFAIRYTAGKTSRWDNNRGQNYSFRYAGMDNSANILPGRDLDEPWLYHFC